MDEPAVSSPEPTLAALLQAVPEFTVGTDLAAFVSGLIVDAGKLDKNGRDALVQANIRRVRIGQAWATAMPAKRADREAWMRGEGEVHGLGLTRVRQIIRAAVAIDKALADVSSDHLPIAVLDRKLEAIPSALRGVLDGRGPDDRQTRKSRPTPANAEERRQAFAARVKSALRTVYAGHKNEIPAALKALRKLAVSLEAAPEASPSAVLRASRHRDRENRRIVIAKIAAS